MFLNERPPSRVQLPHILRVKSGQTLKGRLAGLPVRVETHYIKNRTLPCVRHTAPECPLCEHVGNPRYYSYWPIAGAQGMTAAVELTELAERQLIQLLPDDSLGWGTLVQFHRPSGRRNNPVEVSFPYNLSNNEENLKKAVINLAPEAVHQTLFRLWECPERAQGESLELFLTRCTHVLVSRYLHLVQSSVCAAQ